MSNVEEATNVAEEKKVYLKLSKTPPNIDVWKPKKCNNYVEVNGKLFVANFVKVFNQPNFRPYETFMIKKGSYENQLPTIVKYTNYFMSCYDLDMELMTAYVKIKNAVDKLKLFTEENMDSYIDFLYEVMFTPTMILKINQMVEDNYKDDIEGQSSAMKKKYQKNEKKHLESLEFTNKHIKILLRISFAIKIMSPALFHYLARNVIKVEKDSDIIFRFFKRFFDIFGEGVNMYNKLYVYVKTKVGESNSNNNPIFEQREIFGIDLFSVIEQFVKRVLISENIVKYKFNENIIGFNKVVVKFQLGYFLKESYAKNLTEVSNIKNSEGLSGSDKMMMNLSKINEGETIMADINIDETLEKIMRDNDIEITEDELNYYKAYYNPSKLQVHIVRTYWAKYFGSYRELNLLTKEQFLKLALLLKKQLLIIYAYDNSREEGKYHCILPFIITGNVEGKINSRMIRNTKFINKVTENYNYQYLIVNKFNMVEHIKKDYLISYLSQFINTQFTYVSYEHPDLLGKPIEYSEDKIADELLFFLKLI